MRNDDVASDQIVTYRAAFTILGVCVAALLFGCAPNGHQDDSFMIRPGVDEFANPSQPAPSWLRHAVVVEFPIRGFNHPNTQSPESWTDLSGGAPYATVTERLEFLRDFGVNTICLYSIYQTTPTNLYAIRHDTQDPAFGTLEDVKDLINTAHQLGIRVLSNTNYYGVDRSSPMLDEHPDWFLPPNQIMYDQRVFDLSNPEVVNYIIDTHVWWCLEVGLDGWRIDIADETYRRYIWDEVLNRCAAAGKPILLAPENSYLEGHIRGGGWWNFPTFYDMTDPMAAMGDLVDMVPTMKDYAHADPADPYRVMDISSHNSQEPYPYNGVGGTGPREGAYRVQGSRFLFGHNLMFAPVVPWMMAGELFNATHLAVPGVQGHANQGKLLHSYLDWSDLERNADVVSDFQRIMKIREDHPDLFHNNLADTNIVNVPFSCDHEVRAQPYARFIPGQRAAIVVGNERIDCDITFRLNISLPALGFTTSDVMVTDLWTGLTTRMDADQLSRFEIVVPRDKSPGGGVRVILLSAGGQD